MSAKPLLPLSPILGCLVASGAAAAVGMGGWAAYEGVSGPLPLVLMTLVGGWPIAFALAAFVGTRILPPLVARFGFNAPVLAVTGALSGVVPLLGAMLLGMGRAWGDGVSPFAAGDWVHPLLVAAVAGAIGGVTFWLVSEDDSGRAKR